jgi:hypothetical protein
MALERVRPAADIDDCLRCADALCESLSWVTVSSVVEAMLTERLINAPVRLDIYKESCELRSKYPPLFINPDVILYSTGALADRFHQLISPLVTEFQDGKHKHPDSRLALRMLAQTMQNHWYRQLLRGVPRTIKCPVGVAVEDITFVVESLRREESVIFGDRLPPPVLAM